MASAMRAADQGSKAKNIERLWATLFRAVVKLDKYSSPPPTYTDPSGVYRYDIYWPQSLLQIHLGRWPIPSYSVRLSWSKN